MPKTQKIEATEELASEEMVPVTEEVTQKKQGRKEHLFGTALLGFLILIVIGSLSGVGFGAYSVWQNQAVQKQAPSISMLGEVPATEETAAQENNPSQSGGGDSTESKENMAGETIVNAEDLKKAQALDVIVMNGGGEKGVAGAASELLKKEGFTKVSVGNTTGDFSGAAIYTKKDQTALGEALRAKLLATYPKLTVKEALASDKETQTASITVIFGKE